MTGRQFSTHTTNPEVIDALHDGVPPWMKSSLDSWLLSQLRDSTYRTGYFADTGLVHKLERLLRTDLTGGSTYAKTMMEVILNRMNASTDLKLDVVDGIIQTAATYNTTRALEQILLQSGSKWKVATKPGNGYRLEERVDSTVVKAMEDLNEQGGDASDFMTKAWNEAFGRNPNPSAAYSNAIKSVEAASWQVVTPNNSKSTLGVIIKELSTNPQLFEVAVSEKQANKGVETVKQDMSLVWEGQTDRHGTSKPVAPSQGAAEQAIFISISLCQQFTRSLLKRK